MNLKRFLISGSVLSVAYMAMAVLIHGVWLGPNYSGLMGTVWRPQADLTANAWITQGTTVVFCFVFYYLFSRTYRGGGWREGAWFGFLVYFLVGFQATFHAYATYPIPLELALKWFFAGLPSNVILGILASRLHRQD